MAGYTNDYYQQKADNKNKQLLAKKALELKKILEDSASKLASLNNKKEQLLGTYNDKKASTNSAASTSIALENGQGDINAKKSSMIAILKGLGNSGNAKRSEDLAKGNASFKAEIKRANAYNETLKQDREFLQKKSTIEDDILAVNAATKNKTDNAQQSYTNDIEALIQGIIDEQEKFKANLYRSLQTAKLKKYYK